PPHWIKPQLTRLVDEAPAGSTWLHEIKLDGYRMHARIDGGDIRLLTRTGLGWRHRYRTTVSAIRALLLQNAYGELCAVRRDGITSFSRLQAAMDEGHTSELVYYAFDLLFVNGGSTAQLPPIERKTRLKNLLAKPRPGLLFCDHLVGGGPQFYEHASRMALEASCPSVPIDPTHLAIAVSGSSRNVSPRRIRRRRMDRSDRKPAAHWLTSPRLLHREWKPALCRPGRHGDHGRRAQTIGSAARASEKSAHAARCPSAA
ncbi:MAG: hypothetical protein J0H17_17365, partial [Rhizobiales bacterium]|nr:hypothetical protein [Hyphomicrobiales bacterium]